MDDKLVCPYNKSHLIRPEKMAQHIIKCAQKFPNKLVICPFNTTHHVKEEELENHIKECEDKDFERQNIFLNIPGNDPDATNIKCSNSSEEEVINDNNNVNENWKTGNNTASFNPMKKIMYSTKPGNPPIGFGKAGKKYWREVDYKRIQLLKKNKYKSILYLKYPTPDGGEISIYKMLNGVEMPEEMSEESSEESLPDLNPLNLRSPPSAKPSVTGLPKQPVPDIVTTKNAAKTNKKSKRSDKNSLVENGLSDADRMSNFSSVGSRSCNDASQMDRPHQMNFSNALKSKKGVLSKEFEAKKPQMNEACSGARRKTVDSKEFEAKKPQMNEAFSGARRKTVESKEFEAKKPQMNEASSGARPKTVESKELKAKNPRMNEASTGAIPKAVNRKTIKRKTASKKNFNPGKK